MVNQDVEDIITFVRAVEDWAMNSEFRPHIYDALFEGGWMTSRSLGNERMFGTAIMDCLAPVLEMLPAARRPAMQEYLLQASASMRPQTGGPVTEGGGGRDGVRQLGGRIVRDRCR